MIWFLIFGVVALCIVLWVWKHSYFQCRYEILYNPYRRVQVWDDEDRWKMPLWLLMLVILVFMIPMLNVVIFVCFVIGYSVAAYGGDYANVHLHLNENHIISRICKWFNRDMFNTKK